MKVNTVSIFILTYNQEAVIAQTLEGALMQQTAFHFNLVIGEDCSTDGTRSICEAYAKQYPDKITLLPALDKNIGLIANYMRTIKACDGKYIAICDGDDYWTDPLKLQKQVAILEANSQYAIVYTRYTRLFPDGSFKPAVLLNTQKETGFLDLLENNYIPSVTVMFRNIQHEEAVPEWIVNHPYGDWPTYLWILKNGGSIYFLDEDTSVYRIGIGVSAPLIQITSKLISANLKILYDMLNDVAFANRSSAIKAVIAKRRLHLMTSYNRERCYLKGGLELLRNFSLKTNPFQLVKLYFYSVYKSLQKK